MMWHIGPNVIEPSKSTAKATTLLACQSKSPSYWATQSVVAPVPATLKGRGHGGDSKVIEVLLKAGTKANIGTGVTHRAGPPCLILGAAREI